MTASDRQELTLLGTGQVQVLAQRVEQAGAGIQLQGDLLAVDGEGDASGDRLGSGGCGSRRCGLLGVRSRYGRGRYRQRAGDQQVAPGELDVAELVHACGFLL